jgi:hypothetical protein
VIVGARPSAGRAIGTQTVAQASGPHMLLVATGAVAIQPALVRDAGCDPQRAGRYCSGGLRIRAFG